MTALFTLDQDDTGRMNKGRRRRRRRGVMEEGEWHSSLGCTLTEVLLLLRAATGFG
jgi:hypothetical protein